MTRQRRSASDLATSFAAFVVGLVVIGFALFLLTSLCVYIYKAVWL